MDHLQVMNSLYPYRAVDQTCRSNYETTDSPSSVPNNGIKAVGPTRQVTSRSKAALMAAVEKQPVTVYFAVDNSFYPYRSGIYSSSTCGSSINHASKKNGNEELLNHGWTTSL